MKLLALLATAATIAGGATLAEQILPDVTNVAGEVSIQQVADSAYLLSLTEPGVTWPQALQRAREELRSGYENITVTGTVIRWEEAGHCYEASVPTADTRVTVTECPQSPAQQP